MTVLVVDDERKMAELVRRGFAEAGIAADLAETGGAAVAKARDSEYEAIVLDVQLPGLDAGADIYLTKPFSLDELVGWVRDPIDDRAAGREGLLEAGDLRLDVGARRAWRGA